MQRLKKSLDIVYYGNLTPIVNLENISRIYNENILLTIYKVRNNEQEPTKAVHVLLNAREKINALWADYKKLYKNRGEIKIFIETENLLLETDRRIVKLIDIYKKHKDHYYKKINVIYILRYATKAQGNISKIIDYELKLAKALRQQVVDEYDFIVKLLVFIIIFAFILSISISLPIIKNIRFNQYELYRYAMRLKYSNSQLQESVITDPMTKLYNRRHFNSLFENEKKRAKREGKQITFMMFDIDFFKQYNDTYGHQMGDDVIISVANLLQHTFKRPGDYNFRLGGEEFATILYDTDFAHSQVLAEELIKNLKEKKIEHKCFCLKYVKFYVLILLGKMLI
jgi:diguanylate cyclase (GGDEF)-like protein